MKTKLTLSLLLIISGAVCIHAEQNDTVKIIENVNNLIISQKSKVKTTIIATTDNNTEGFIYEIEATDTGKIENDKWLMSLPFVKKNQKNNAVRSVTAMKNIYAGWIFNYDGKGAIKNVSEWGVLEVMGINLKPFKSGPQIDFGIGFGKRNYSTKEGWRFAQADGKLLVIPATDVTVKKSDMSSWTFHVPVILSQKLYKLLTFSAGPIFNFNTYTTATSEYYYNEIKYKEKYKGLHQQFLTVDLLGQIGFKEGLSFYCRWSPMSLFNDNNGPHFRTVSIGFTLNY
ncbi:MAG: hypothetical protein J1E38_07565 [Paramuribaculum sp.]|nr:hypothetical protein [Paramuribaculum sp.]